MVHPSFDYLRTFLAVYRAGSLTAAARVVDISQPAVSGQIQALERQLGFTLFLRRGRGIEPTARAVDLAREVADHLDRLERITHGEPAATTEQPRTLHLAGPAEFLSERVLPILGSIGAGRLNFRVRFGLAESLLDELAAGSHDVVVSSVLPKRRGVSSVPLIDEDFVLVGSPAVASSLAPAPPGFPPANLDLIPVVAYAEDLPIIRRYWRSVFDRRPDALRIQAVVPDLRDIARMVACGAGMSVLPRYLAEPLLETGALMILLDPELPPLNTLHLATQQGVLQRDDAVRELQDALLADSRAVGRR